MDEQNEYMPGQGPEQGQKKKNTAFIKLCISLAVLGTALVLRIFFPEQTRDFLQKNVAGGLDYTAVLGGLGDGIRSFVTGVPHPDSLESGEAPRQISGPGGGDEQAGIPFSPGAETYDPEHEPPPVRDGITEGGIGGFGLPIYIADARYFLSDPGEDDTLPLPFGMQKPDRVDYTVYELPFETSAPAEGRLSSSFGYRIHPVYGGWRFHYGIDIANAAGTPIAAFADGTVSAAGSSTGYGNYVIIEHDGGFYTLYAHCMAVDVRAGQTVSRGQQIATIGSTGVTTGPHLHFELRYGSAFLDPENYIDR